MFVKCKVVFSSIASGDKFSGTYFGEYEIDGEKLSVVFNEGGQENAQTIINVDDNDISVSRNGFGESFICLSYQKITKSYIRSPYGEMQFDTLLNESKLDFSNGLIRFKAQYDCFSGNVVDKNSFSVILKPINIQNENN